MKNASNDSDITLEVTLEHIKRIATNTKHPLMSSAINFLDVYNRMMELRYINEMLVTEEDINNYLEKYLTLAGNIKSLEN